MTTSTAPFTTPVRGVSTIVAAAGQSVIALGAYTYGGYIVNPALPVDQGLVRAETLFVDPTGPASLKVTATTVALFPGSFYRSPAGLMGSVWVNAATAGHRFSAIGINQATQYPPTPTPSLFPPLGPTGLTGMIPAYLYEEYADDDDLQAFFASFNAIAQSYLDTLNALNLPVYTGPLIMGSLLDWIATGFYGMPRPALSSGVTSVVGPLNTYLMNTIRFAEFVRSRSGPMIVTRDDVFKRILTWHLYKGDGKVFDIRWLKRRIMRFLLGENGTAPNIDQSYQVSITFGPNSLVSIRLLSFVASVTGGAFYNRLGFNTQRFNEINTKRTPLTPLPNAAIFKEAADSGALELPFQYTFTVTV